MPYILSWGLYSYVVSFVGSLDLSCLVVLALRRFHLPGADLHVSSVPAVFLQCSGVCY